MRAKKDARWTMTAEADRDSQIAAAVLRASVASRRQQAGMALAAMILNTAFCAVLLGRGVNGVALSTFLIVCTGLLLVRYAIASKARHALEAGDQRELALIDWQFRWVSVASQTVMGAMIWIVYGTESEVSAYVVTLLICLYATGTMINLAQDYRSFRLTIPLLMVQPVIFWIDRHDGLVIAVILVGLTLLMISSVRNSQRNLEDSVRIRFEKDDLLRQLEREKQTALNALQQAEIANRSKSFFMAAASHDLRQPLYAATILCDTLGLHNLPPEPARLLHQQGKALKAASGLFDNLLDLTKFESGAVVPTFTSVNLRELLKEVESEFSALCKAKGLSLNVVVTDDPVWSDYDLLDRVVRNLVSNAVRYTAAGGVRVEARRVGEHMVLSVEDTGIGIDPQDQARIFTEFVQIANPQRTRDHGVGLGLAIVRHISRLLGFEVTVASTRGAGTRMSMQLPIAAQSQIVVSAEDTTAPRCDLRDRSAWIVDDDVGVREALVAYFEAQHCRCAAASSREDLLALQSTAGALPDFVLIDDMLSERESGLDVARWLAARMDPGSILVMTGNPSPDRWRELLESGFVVLRKPIPAGALNDWLVRQAKTGPAMSAEPEPLPRTVPTPAL
jgi:signal transduction histidine kinase/CheY-like chemotaxis protein